MLYILVEYDVIVEYNLFLSSDYQYMCYRLMGDSMTERLKVPYISMSFEFWRDYNIKQRGKDK